MKKKLVILGAAAITAAAAVPALAFENEFHGMFRVYGYASNSYSSKVALPAGTVAGTTDLISTTVADPAGQILTLSRQNRISNYVEQRARLQYIAKASDDLKLVTHFELDSLWGGGTATKYQGTDAGGLDADQVTLETKNVYLDFNIPSAPVNVKVGIQPFNDAYQGVFGNFDGTGAYVTGKFGIVTPSLGWFRVAEDAGKVDKAAFYPGKHTTDLTVLNVKVAPTKDISAGLSYYYLGRDSINNFPTLPQTPTYNFSATAPAANNVNTVGLDVAAKLGPANLTAFGAYQFGQYTPNVAAAAERKLNAFAAGAVAKVKVGPGNISLSGVYLSGSKDPGTDKDNTGTGPYRGWQQLAPTGSTSYFGASNMWLLIRNNATINTSTALGGTDLTKGGRGFVGAFLGMDATIGKVFVAANGGYAEVAEKRGGEKRDIGYEVNATVGYKLYDSLAISLNGAYALLGDGMASKNPVHHLGYTPAKENLGAFTNAFDPWVAFVRVDYTF